MILYTVYKNDWECPEKIFDTFIEDKAKQFVELQNKYVIDDMDKYFISTLDLTDIEKKADNILNKFQIKKITKINIENSEYTIIYSRIQSVNIDEEVNRAEIYDYEGHKWSQAIVTLITDEDTEINLKDPLIKKQIEKLIKKELASLLIF